MLYSLSGSCPCLPPPVNDSKTEKFSLKKGKLNDPPSLMVKLF